MDDRGKQLLSAALAGDENRVSELLSEVEDGTNVNYQNSDGWSPLHVAACKGHANIIRLLHQALSYGPLSHDPEWFNDDANFAAAMEQKLYLQHGSVEQVKTGRIGCCVAYLLRRQRTLLPVGALRGLIER